MSKDVSAIIAKLDAKVAEITSKDEKKDDMEILEGIGKEKLQNYLVVMSLKMLHNVLQSSGYKGSLVSLRKQLAALGAREIQPRPGWLEKGKKAGGKQKEKQKRKEKQREELTQVSLLPPESKAPEKQPEKQTESPQEAPRTIHINEQGAGTQAQQQAAKQPERPAQQSAPASAAQDVEDFEGLFARRGAMRVE